MGKFIWYSGEIPEWLPIQQVYGILFTDDGRIMLRVPKENGIKVFTLAGGKTESFDKGMEDTLRRELLEEVNTSIETPILVGYQTYHDGNGELPLAQARMVAKIDKIGKAQPDPDSGEIYERFLTTPQKAIERLNWGEPGRAMMEEAVRIATEKLNLNHYLDKDEFV